MQTIRWAIIGCGNVTELKSGPALQLAENSTLSMVMRRDAALCEDYARRHQVPQWTTDVEAILQNPDIDAVYVATPPSTHRDYAKRVLAAGKPVYVEKPLAMDAVECAEMIDASRACGLPGFTAYYRRRLPYFVKIKALLEVGAIGDIRTVRITHLKPGRGLEGQGWRMDKAVSGGGLLHDVGSHTLDIIDYLAGPIEEVQAFTANQRGLYTVEDTVCASFRFASGALGTGTWSFESACNTDANEIEGTQGRIRFSTFGNTPIEVTYADGSTETFAYETPKHIQQPMIQHVVNCLLGKEQPVSTFETAARTSWVLDQICGQA